jgi:hypothetical protein
MPIGTAVLRKCLGAFRRAGRAEGPERKKQCPVPDMVDVSQCNDAFFIAGVIPYGSVQTIEIRTAQGWQAKSK